jgi:hypothetical protein
MKQMVEAAAELTGIPQPTVNVTARILQKAGLIQTGQPGRYGGSRMTADDVAALSIGLLATAGEYRAMGSAEVLVERLSKMKMDSASVSMTIGKSKIQKDGDRIISVTKPSSDVVYNVDVGEAAAAIHLDSSDNFFQTVVKLVSNPKLSREVLGYDVCVNYPTWWTYISVAERLEGRRRETIVTFADAGLSEHKGFNVARSLSGWYFRSMNSALEVGD